MTKLEVKNLKNEKVKDLSLDKNIWDVEVNEVVLKKAIRLQLDSLRQGTAKTKTRSEVSGGGKKPWKQKGTGRARQGSIRAPHWRGGGIATGVLPRNYTFKINKKERVLALKSALLDKINNKALIVVDTLEIKDAKTSTVKELIKTLNLNGKVLFITSDEGANLYLATRNLGYAYTIMAEDVNPLDLVNADVVVVEEKAYEKIEEVLK